MSGHDKFIRNNLDDDVGRILYLDIIKARGIEKFIIPITIFTIYTRLEILLGLKFSGHKKTLTEASNFTDDLHKRGEMQNEQQYRNV